MFSLSPDLIIEGAAKGIVTGSFIAFGMMFVSALVLGGKLASFYAHSE